MVILMLSYSIRIMDPNSSLGKICLGDNVIEISSDKIEGSGDWDSPEYQDTASSIGKKVVNTFSFYRMETDEISERYIAPCFGNGLEAYDGEINLALDESLISNEYVVKLCLDYEIRKGKKLVKKEPIVALKGELYFVKFIINPKEDDVEPGVILGRSFLRLAKGIVDFRNGVITIYPESYPFDDDSEKTGKCSNDWDQLLDFNFDDIPKFGEELPPFVCKMGKSNRNKNKVMENLDLFYQDIGPSSSSGRHLTQGEAEKEALAIRISQKFEGKVNENALADTRSDMNTMPYQIYEQLGRDDLKNEDRGITMINHTQTEAMGKLSNVLCQVGFTTLIAEFLILDILIDCDSPIVVGRGFLRTISGMINTSDRIFSTFDGFCHQTFRAARSDYMRNVESDSDDEEEYVIKRNKFGAPIYGPRPAPYIKCTNPEDRASAIQAVTNPFRKISVWKKAVSFLGSLPVPLKLVNWKPEYKGSYTKEEEAIGQCRTKIRITDPYRNIYLQGFTTKKTDRTHDDKTRSLRSKRSRHETVEEVLLPKFTMSFCYGNDAPEMLSLKIDKMLRIKLREAESGEEIFTSVAWIRAFNINEPIYAELWHEFYSTYEFDEVCASDELQTKKIIKFRLGGHAHSLTLLEFARRLGLYETAELDEDGFNVYFEGGLRSDEHFNAQEYWLSIGREENLGLSRSHTSTIKNPILRVIYKMITYGLCQRITEYDKIQKNNLWLLSMFEARHQNGYANVAWLIAKWMKKKGAGIQKDSQIFCRQFITKLARKCRVLTEDVVRSFSALIYCRDLDKTTLRDLIDFDGNLIPEDPQPGVPIVGIPRPPRASMHDLYDRMRCMKIRQDAIDRMEYRQSYNWDRYHGVFEHMVRVYSVPLLGAYNPPGYAQPQYDQYYQKYPPQQQ
ncbi:retrotransposon ORF1 [Tanacetum coccineum]